MKLVGIGGSIAEKSYNRMLLNYISKKFNNLFELESLDISDVPMFNQSEDQTESDVIQNLAKKIEAADGVIISTPEHNHTIPAPLKSVIEWLSFNVHPFDKKPILIVGASYFDQGSSRAQLHLRTILEAPGVNAFIFPGNEFLLGNVKEAFDEQGNLKDQGTVDFLESVLKKYKKYVNLVKQLDEPEPSFEVEEDLFATGKIDTTIDVDMYADDWVDQAAKKVNAVEGDAYVKLDQGVLTVNQLDAFLKTMPMELTYADSNNQFLYYNYMKPTEEMLAKRKPSQVGNPLAKCHPEQAHKGVQWVVQALRSGEKDVVRVNVPTHGPDKYVVHSYEAVRDEDGTYLGINEYVQDIKPIIDFYLEQTGQELVGGKVDTVSGATTKNDDEVDAVSSATENA